jgi:protein-serine/threonine kinase
LVDNPSNSSSVPADRPPSPDAAVYGDQAEDVGDEVRFSVELTRLDRLKDMYSLDIRRLKGNLKSYKFLYDTLRM